MIGSSISLIIIDFGVFVVLLIYSACILSWSNLFSLALFLLEGPGFLVVLEDLLCREFFEIQDVWELNSVVELEIPESIEVKNDSLQMDDELIG